MTSDQLRARVREALDRHFRNTPHGGQPMRGEIPTTDASRLQELVIDELDRLEITLAVEEEFDVELDYDHVASIETVSQLADHVAERLYPAVAA